MLTTGTQSSRRHRACGDRLADPRRPVPAAGPALPGRAAGTSLAATISLAICTAVLAAPAVLAGPPLSVPTQLAEGPVPIPQSSGIGPLENGSDRGVEQDRADTGHDETLAALEAAILRLEGEIAELGRLADWQARLLAAARTDPDGARRLRRPRSSCLKTPLAPFCDRLNGMYRDNNGRLPAGEGDR